MKATYPFLFFHKIYKNEIYLDPTTIFTPISFILSLLQFFFSPKRFKIIILFVPQKSFYLIKKK